MNVIRFTKLIPLEGHKLRKKEECKKERKQKNKMGERKIKQGRNKRQKTTRIPLKEKSFRGH